MAKDSEVKNLKAIADALAAHEKICKSPPVEIQLNPYEVKRLDWDDFNGIPIVGETSVPTGRIRIVCANDKNNNESVSEEVVEAVSKDRELETV